MLYVQYDTVLYRPQLSTQVLLPATVTSVGVEDGLSGLP